MHETDSNYTGTPATDMMPIFPSSSSPIRFDDTTNTELSSNSTERNKICELNNSVFDLNNGDRANTTNKSSELINKVIECVDDEDDSPSNNKYSYENNNISIYDELLNESSGTNAR